jgi:hypothetical protein
MRKFLVGVAALSSIALLALTTAPAAVAAGHVVSAGPGAKAPKMKHHRVTPHDPTIYDSTVQPNPGNLASESYEATATAEFGNQISFAGTARVLDTVVVQMSSWGCQSGNWSTYNTAPCVTSPGSTFTEPITLNVYNVGPPSAYGPSTAGSLITSVTQTFSIPYRPSADTNYTTDCAATATADNVPVSDFAGTWYDAALNSCFNGYLTPITFTLGHVVIPNDIVYGIAYNTSDFGYAPQGDNTACHSSSGGCGYDSLNVAVSQQPTAPSVGSNDYPGTVYQNIDNAGYQSNYCDGGAAGINVFRIDEPANYPTGNGTTSGCWGQGTAATPWYIPAVQFNAVSSPSPSITSVNSANVVAGTPFSFEVTTTGVPVPAITKVGGKFPKGLTLVDNHNGTATISGTALKTDLDKVYTVVIRAKNGRNSVAKQHLMLTLTGGR